MNTQKIRNTSTALTGVVAGVALAGGLTLAPAVLPTPFTAVGAHAATAPAVTNEVNHASSITFDKFHAQPGANLEQEDLGLAVNVTGFEAGDYSATAIKGDMTTPPMNFTVDESGQADFRVALFGDEVSDEVAADMLGDWELEVVRVGGGDVSSVSTTTFTVTEGATGDNAGDGDTASDLTIISPDQFPVESLFVDDPKNSEHVGFVARVENLEPGKTYVLKFQNQSGNEVAPGQGEPHYFEATADDEGAANFGVYLITPDEVNGERPPLEYSAGTYSMDVLESQDSTESLASKNIDITTEEGDVPSTDVTIDHDKTIPVNDYMLEQGAGETIPEGYGLDITVSGLDPKAIDTYTLRVTPQGENAPELKNNTVKLLPDEGGNAHERIVERYADSYDEAAVVGKRTVEVLGDNGEVLASSEFEVVANDAQAGGSDEDPSNDSDQSNDAQAGGSDADSNNDSNQTNDATGASSSTLPRTGVGLAGLGVGVALLAAGAIAMIASRRKA